MSMTAMDLEQDDYVMTTTSLPYIDGDVDPQTRSAIQMMIEQEMTTFTPDYLDTPPVDIQFSIPRIQEEWNKILENDGDYHLPEIDNERYTIHKPNDRQVEVWEDAIKRAKIKLSHIYTSIENLELFDAYGTNSYVYNIEKLERNKELLQSVLEDYKKEVKSVNRKRHKEQKAAGKKLERLEQEWKQLVLSRKNIDDTIVQLEEEIAQKRAIVDDDISLTMSAYNDYESSGEE
eukprot:TRINITY_DN896_c0_g1_i1.p1 TRINITY_DN896_c0_g1~~TRINITY_DN896_c0_g1_i1.p1  ORF type:complete len:233 (+),score=73.25 TRINITY_DN896_c0_g1_i1:367-1065(+)